jgi:flagellar hook-associated protein 2
MSSTSSTNALFTGSSQFSSSLQAAITRAVSFASLPLEQMQSELTTLQSQQSEAQTLNTDFANVQSAVSAVESAITGTSAFSASVSNTGSSASSSSPVASVSLTGTPSAGTYSIDVTGTGAYANSMSDDGLTTVADPTSGNISDASNYTLTVGAATYTITPSGNTLSDLADALNASGDVQATLVNIGGSSSPDYRLSLEGTELGDLPIQLTTIDGSNPGQTLMTAQSPPGAPAEYQVNGEPDLPIQSSTSTVTISPGVSVSLLDSGTATVTVSPSTEALSSAFSNLATAYNNAMSDINKNHGQSGGALAGDSLLLTLTDALQSIAGYTTGNSGISSLASLGFSFDSSGVLSFDSSAFASATSGQTAQLLSFLGSSSTGGFLEAASNALAGIEDPTDGVLTQDLSSLSSQITTENTSISDEQDKVNTLQTNLTQQMATADAAIATMEQQLVSLQGYFQAMQTEEQEYAE